MMRIICALLALLMLCGCAPADSHNDCCINAAEYGVLPSNSGKENSRNLQSLIDQTAKAGGTIYIPAGEYNFSENGRQTIGSHCIKLRSNVSIVGDGEVTVLKPVGVSQYGLDMFYFNDYLDTGEAVYLDNCRFQDFVIDASGTKCEVYTSAGKGFMINLFRNCHWEGVTVKHTDATGFGVDCPIGSSMQNCVAIGCGKAATVESSGASGFGIGYGYCANENLTINDCYAQGNKKFGFFFEHQGRFDPDRYDLSNQGMFQVINCKAQENLYNFGGILAKNISYIQCISGEAKAQQVYFENCENCKFYD